MYRTVICTILESFDLPRQLVPKFMIPKIKSNNAIKKLTKVYIQSKREKNIRE